MDVALNPQQNPQRARRWGETIKALATAEIKAALAIHDLVSDDDAMRTRLTQGIDDRFRCPRDPTLVRRFLADDLRTGRVFIYGGGTHTAVIIDILREKPGLELLGIIDRAAEPSQSRFGLPLFPPDILADHAYDHILLSHQEFEPQMRRTLAGLAIDPAVIWSIYDSSDYLATTLPAMAELDLPASADNVLINFLAPTNGLSTDSELASIFDPARTVKLHMGRPHLFEASAVFPTVSLKQSAAWLAATLKRLRPSRILIRSSFQFNSIAWVIWLRHHQPETKIILELYDWAFTLPNALLKGQFLYDDAEVEDENRGEMLAIQEADIILHKYGGRHWRPFVAPFREKMFQAFPVIGRGPSRMSTIGRDRADGPLRLVSAGGLPPEHFVRRFAPEYAMFESLIDLAGRMPVEIDVFNVVDKPNVDPTLFASYREKYSGYPLKYHRAIPFDEMQTRLETYDFGLLALTFDFAEFRLMDAVCLGNKFLSYIGAGLPVICSTDDIYTASLVRHFKAGIIIGRDELPELDKHLLNADLTILRDGIGRLREYMYASNRRLRERLISQAAPIGVPVSFGP